MPAPTGTPWRCSRSIPRRRTRAERSSATGCACRSTPPTRASSSDRWPRGATSAAWPWRRPRRCASSTRRATRGSSWRPWASVRPRSTWRPPPTRPSWCSRRVSATPSRWPRPGILEVADVFVVNKADRDGAARRRPRAAADAPPGRRARLGAAGPGDRGARGRGHRRALGQRSRTTVRMSRRPAPSRRSVAAASCARWRAWPPSASGRWRRARSRATPPSLTTSPPAASTRTRAAAMLVRLAAEADGRDG